MSYKLQRRLKIILIILGILAFVLAVILIFIPGIKKSVNHKDASPVKLSAVCNKEYDTFGEAVDKSDFTVNLVYDDGSSVKVSEGEYTIDAETITAAGDRQAVTVTYTGEKSYKTNVTLEIKREEIERFHIGNPVTSDVSAVLYSNGVLDFEGSGDTLQYNAEHFPWNDYDEEKDYPVRAVVFESTVSPLSLNSWFINMDSLIFVGKIPESVTSMNSTFYGCDSLSSMADWKECKNLLDISGCYEKCTVLTGTSSVPENVKEAVECFKGCENLKKTPDFSTANSLTSLDYAFADCGMLIDASLPAKVKTLESTFSGCINLKEMPDIPKSAVNMRKCFEDCISLNKLTNIPAKVTDITECFSGCTHMEGKLTIDAEPESYSNFMYRAAVATDVDLTGKSKMIKALARSTGMDNVTVNGKNVAFK